MRKTPDIFFIDNLESLLVEDYGKYFVHALCLEGHCSFKFNEADFELNPGDLMIVTNCNFIDSIKQSPDFKVKNLMAKASFIELCTPRSNYGMTGHLALFVNPVMNLNPEQRITCENNFKCIEHTLSLKEHNFYREYLANAVQRAILDFFDFHVTLNKKKHISNTTFNLMTKFMELLDAKEFRRERAVTYYSNILCITPKYLSEVCKKVSGFSANYWINRYTITDISRLLKDQNLSFAEISDLFHFPSPAYFSRYVQRYLGITPTDSK